MPPSPAEDQGYGAIPELSVSHKGRQRWQKAFNVVRSFRSVHPITHVEGAEELAGMVREHDGRILQAYGGIGGVADYLSTSLDNGMHDDALQIQKRQEEFGANTYPGQSLKGFFVCLLGACKDRAFFCFILCAVHSFQSGVKRHGANELAAIVVLVLLSGLVSAFTNYRQGLQCALLKNEEMQNVLVNVVRGGRRMQIPIFGLVVGDITFPQTGDQVPADGLLVGARTLCVDLLNVTGESGSIPVNEEMPFLLSGCKVIQGSGKMLVTGVGIKTEQGCLMVDPKEDAGVEMPLQVRLIGLTTFVNLIGLAGGTLVLLILLISDFVGHREDSSNSGRFEAAHLRVFASVVVFVLSNGPFLALSVSLTCAMKRMLLDRVVLRRLSAVETMGSVTTICADQGGLLALNQITTMQTSGASDYQVVEGEDLSTTVCSPLTRPGVVDVVQMTQTAGLKVCMITGTDLATAEALPADCGTSQSGNAIEGSGSEGCTAEMKRQELPRMEVTVGSSTSQSLLFVHNLCKSGEVAAVTEDNLPTLNEADIGLSMGRTEVANKGSDIIMLDDKFTSVLNVLYWGRSIWLNIQTFVLFQLTVNVAALSLNFMLQFLWEMWL